MYAIRSYYENNNKASGLKDALHPTVLYNVLCAVIYYEI